MEHPYIRAGKLPATNMRVFAKFYRVGIFAFGGNTRTLSAGAPSSLHHGDHPDFESRRTLEPASRRQPDTPRMKKP